MAIANGIITHIDSASRFAYLSERNGDSIRIQGNLKDFGQLELGSQVVLQFENQFVQGDYKKGATNLLTIDPPFEPVTVLGTVVRVSDKGFAFARCDTIDEDIHIGADVFRKADVKPGPDMPVLVTVGQNVRGFAATELRWKPEELAVWRAENLEVLEGVLKHFDHAKKFGHLRLEDGSQIFFHLNGVAEELRAGLFTREYRRARFAFVVTEYKGKPVAMVTKLVSLAPEPEVESAEVVAVEATVSVEGVVDASAESEAKPAKAPRRKAAVKSEPKPKTAKPASPKKASAKKSTKAAGKVTDKSGAIPSAKDYPSYAEQSTDLASMAKKACQNGGGALAQAMLAAAVPAGNA